MVLPWDSTMVIVLVLLALLHVVVYLLQSINAVHWIQCMDGAGYEGIINRQRRHDNVADLCRTFFQQRL